MYSLFIDQALFVEAGTEALLGGGVVEFEGREQVVAGQPLTASATATSFESP